MTKKADVKLLLSLLTVAVVWGTTYLGIRVAVETIQPWYVTSIRQGIAALLIFVYLLYQKQFQWIGWANFVLQMIPALMMIVIQMDLQLLLNKHFQVV